jgi:AcrR family transcriptional regulator
MQHAQEQGRPVTTHAPRARLVRNSRVLRRADEIIDAAARVFAERGYHGTTTQAIGDVLGMRQASLYYYFPSKEAALEEVCARGTDGFVDGAERVMQMDVTPLEKLKLLIASHLVPVETMPDYVRVFINERRYLPDASRKRVGRKSRRIERFFEQVIQAGIDDGSIREGTDARLAMLAVLGMCNAVINWREPERAKDIGGITSGFADIVANGLASAKGAPKR